MSYYKRHNDEFFDGIVDPNTGRVVEWIKSPGSSRSTKNHTTLNRIRNEYLDRKFDFFMELANEDEWRDIQREA